MTGFKTTEVQASGADTDVQQQLVACRKPCLLKLPLGRNLLLAESLTSSATLSASQTSSNYLIRLAYLLEYTCKVPWP